MKYSVIYSVESILEVDDGGKLSEKEIFNNIRKGDFLQWGWHGKEYTMRIYNENLARETHYINLKLHKRCENEEDATNLLHILSANKGNENEN